MKKNLHLTATLDQPELLEDMVERLATLRNENSHELVQVPGEWQVMETSSIEVYASGSVEFDYNDEQRIRVPFVTCLIFSCTRENNNCCDVCWAASFN